MQLIVKISMIFLLMFAISGCSCKPKVIKQTIEVKIPVKCIAPEVICDYCATAFKERDHLDASQANIKNDYERHPSIAKYTNDG